MKFLVVLAAAVAVVLSQSPNEEAIKKEALETREKCVAEVKGTPEDLKEFEKNFEITTDMQKKIMLCVFRAHKIIGDDGKFSKAAVVETATKFLKDRPDAAERLKVADEIATTCEKEVGTAEAAPEETTKVVFDCLKKNVFQAKVAEWPFQSPPPPKA